TAASAPSGNTAWQHVDIRRVSNRAPDISIFLPFFLCLPLPEEFTMYRFNDLANPIHIPAIDRTEALPFTVKLVHTPGALAKAVYIREHAYGRHVPELARSLGTPEVYDNQPGTVIL